MTAILHENVMTNNWQIFYKPGYDCCPNARWLSNGAGINLVDIAVVVSQLASYSDNPRSFWFFL